MREFNLIALSLCFCLISTLGTCYLADTFIGSDAKYFCFAVAFAIGMSARRITEKLLGYTLKEAQKD